MKPEAKTQPSKAATRAAEAIADHDYKQGGYATMELAQIIDRETGLPELLEAVMLVNIWLDHVEMVWKNHDTQLKITIKPVLEAAIRKAEGEK